MWYMWYNNIFDNIIHIIYYYVMIQHMWYNIYKQECYFEVQRQNTEAGRWGNRNKLST